jgi:PHD/YefM family antitoxin component YafN of YafNO toxin-antitoxin module
MIAISKELQQAVKDSKDNLVRLVDPETNAEYVVLSAETFAQMQEKLYDDGPLTPEERRSLLVQAGLRAGWDDPEMDVYNELDPRREDESSTR